MVVGWFRRRLGVTAPCGPARFDDYDGEELCYVDPAVGPTPPDPRDPVLVAAALHLIRVGILLEEVRILIPATLRDQEIPAARESARVGHAHAVVESA